MEVVAAEPAGDVYYLADAVEAGDFFGLHGFGVEFGGVDSSGGDFCFGVAFGACGDDAPGVELPLHFLEGWVGPVCGGMEGEPALCHAGGEDGAEGLDGGAGVAAGVAGEEGRGDVESGGEVEFDGLAGLPVGGDLEDGGAAEAAVGDEHFLAEGGAGVAGAGGGDDLRGEAGEITPAGAILRGEGERDERGAGGDDAESELFGEGVAEAGGTHPGDGEAAGGDDQGHGLEGACGGFDAEAGVVRSGRLGDGLGDGDDFGAEEGADFGVGAFALQHGDDFLCGAVAEELAESFFVVTDAVFFNQRDEVCGGVACECGLGEVRVGGEEVFWAAVDVSEVAAATSGDEDFFAGLVCVVEQEDAATAATCFDGTHHAGATGS